MPSGYTATLPDDVLLDTGVLYHDVATVSTPFGVTRGGTKFSPEKESRQIEFDGRRSDIEGNDRITKHGGMISGTFIQMGAAQFAVYEAGSTAVVVTGTTTITPKAASALYAAGDYVTNLFLTFQRAGGGTATVKFAKALCPKYDISSQDNDEVQVSAEFHARLGATAAAASTDTAPYTIVLVDGA